MGISVCGEIGEGPTEWKILTDKLTKLTNVILHDG